MVCDEDAKEGWSLRCADDYYPKKEKILDECKISSNGSAIKTTRICENKCQLDELERDGHMKCDLCGLKQCDERKIGYFIALFMIYRKSIVGPGKCSQIRL